MCPFGSLTLTDVRRYSELVDPLLDADDEADDEAEVEDDSDEDELDDELESLEELAVVLEVLDAEPPDFELSVL